MTIRAQSADGVIHEFPDGTNPTVIDGAMKAYAGQAKPAPAEKPYTVLGEMSDSLGRLKSDMQTAYSPTPDQAKAKANVFAVDRIGGDAFDLVTSPIRGAVNKYINKPLSKATGLPEQDIQAYETGLAMMAGAPSTGALLKGGAARVGLERAAAAPKPVAPRPAMPKAMSIDELAAAKNNAYKAVDASGITYTPKAFSGLVDNVETATKAQNISPIRHPKAASMVSDLVGMSDSQTAPTLTELDQLRQVVRRDVANSRDDAEAHMGRAIIKQIDAFVDGTGPEHVAAGSATNAAELIGNARDLNTRHRKVEAVTDAIEAAKLRAGSTGSGGNIDNATRSELKKVLVDTPNLTPDEKGLLRSIVMGDRGQNTLRQVGKLSPQGNGLMQAGHLMALGPTGGMSAVAAVAGAGAKVAADAITQRKVQNLVRLMSIGGKAPGKIERAAAAAQTTSPNIANINSLDTSLGQDLTNRAAGR